MNSSSSFRLVVLFTAFALELFAQTNPPNAKKILPGHIANRVSQLSALGSASNTNELHLAIGLPLRDSAGLDQFLADVYDPASPNFRKFLTSDELAARFGPTEADYAAVKKFAAANGFSVNATHPNRLVLDVVATTTNVERAFNIHLNRFQHPTEARQFFAPDSEPSVDAALPVVDVQGLTDYSRPRPRLRHQPADVTPRSGSSPDGKGLLFGDDFRKAYAPGTTLTGAGQMVGLVQFDGYYTNDILSYARNAGGGRTNIIIQNVLLDGFNGTPTTGVNSGNGEVSLDIEMSMAVAPGLSKIVVFEAGPTGNPNDVLNSMLTFSNSVKNLSCSWGWDGGPTNTTDNIFKLMAAAGQSFFNASGDSDAFVPGSNNEVDNPAQVNVPSSNPYITQVGGTVMATNGFSNAFTSESVWNDHVTNNNGGYWGSSGGISTFYAIPSWQTNTSMALNSGSATKRNIPDVALTADYIYSTYDNGSGGRTGGTSCAAPLWAGFMALVNQQAAAQGYASVGFINPAIYAISRTTNYTNCFHDTTVGDNAWPNSAGKFAAVAGYDLATGLGTPTGTNLINALAPLLTGPPQIFTQPTSQTNIFGGTATFTVGVAGSSPFAYQWYFTNAVPGATNASLVIANLATTNAGNYFVIITNSFGSVTSSLAQLTLVAPAAYGGILVAWEMSGLPGGNGNYGPSPYAAASNAPNVNVSGLTRGSGVNTSSTGAGNAWGGAGFTSSSEAAAITANTFATFSVTGSVGYTVSFTNIAAYNIRRSGTGPTTGIWQYQVGAGAFTDIGSAITWGSTTTASGNAQAAIDLSGIAALQNVPAGTNVTFRIVSWSGASSGSWYINNISSGYDLQVLGTMSPVVNNPPTITQQPAGTNAIVGGTVAFNVGAGGSSPLGFQWFKGAAALPNATNVSLIISNLAMTDAGNYSVQVTNLLGSTNSAVAILIVSNQFYRGYDAGLGLSGGENVILTNASGLNLYGWATTDLSLSVTNWQALGLMSELPLGVSGTSRYGITLNPSASPTYYVFARTNVGPYLTVQSLAWLTTDDFTTFSASTSNAPITQDGIFNLAAAAAPQITAQPVATNVYAGMNAAFNATASGTAPLFFQWRKNGIAFADGGGIVGSATNNLKFLPALTNYAGGYSLVVSNTAGAATSSVAQLNVSLPPLLGVTNTGGLATLQFTAISNHLFTVLRSTNLFNWTPAWMTNPPAAATLQFTEPATNLPGMFYRLNVSP